MAEKSLLPLFLYHSLSSKSNIFLTYLAKMLPLRKWGQSGVVYDVRLQSSAFPLSLRANTLLSYFRHIFSATVDYTSLGS
jgi:hypothetical protein